MPLSYVLVTVSADSEGRLLQPQMTIRGENHFNSVYTPHVAMSNAYQPSNVKFVSLMAFHGDFTFTSLGEFNPDNLSDDDVGRKFWLSNVVAECRLFLRKISITEESIVSF